MPHQKICLTTQVILIILRFGKYFAKFPNHQSDKRESPMKSKNFGICLLVIQLCAAGSANALEGDSLWTRHYGGSGFEYVRAICPAGDGGFLLAGHTNSIGAGGYDMYLLKVNAQGDSLWSYAYGDSADDYAYGICPSGDGGFLLAGQTDSPEEDQVYLVKVNAQGNLLWSRHYGTAWDDYAQAIVPSGDGGFLLAGRTSSFPEIDNWQFWLLKVDASGDSVWSYEYGSPVTLGQFATCIAPIGDGNFVLAGWQTEPNIYYPNDMLIVRVDSQGNQTQYTVNNPIVNDNDDEKAYALCPSGDGGFVAAGYLGGGLGVQDAYVTRVDSNGAILWSNFFGGLNWDWANAVMPASDGGFLLGGQVGSYGAGSWDAWLIKVNSQGDSLWARTYGTIEQEFCTAMIPSGDGGYMLAGYTNRDPFGGWNWQMYLVKVEGTETAVSPEEPMMVGEFVSYPCMPNPFNATTVLSFELRVSGLVNLKVYDTAGRLIKTLVNGWRDAGHHQVTFDASDLPSGLYLYRLTSGQNTAAGKMVLLK
jgi:hypothetical protein